MTIKINEDEHPSGINRVDGYDIECDFHPEDYYVRFTTEAVRTLLKYLQYAAEYHFDDIHAVVHSEIMQFQERLEESDRSEIPRAGTRTSRRSGRTGATT